MANFCPLMTEIGLPVWGIPANFNRFRVLACYCSDVGHRRPTKLCTIFGSLLGWYTMYTFLGAFAPWRNFATCKIHLRSRILAALLHCTPSAGLSQTLMRRRTRNGITELSQRAPPIFGWAAITLDIGPHSSFILVNDHLYEIWHLNGFAIVEIIFSVTQWVKVIGNYALLTGHMWFSISNPRNYISVLMNVPLPV